VGHAKWQVCISRGGGAPAKKRGRLAEETHHHTTQAPSSTTCTPQTSGSGSGTPADLFLEWRGGRMSFPGDCRPPAGMGGVREKRRSNRHRSSQWVCGVHMIQTCANGTGPVRQTAVPQTGHAVPPAPRCGVAFAKTGEGRAGEGRRGRVPGGFPGVCVCGRLGAGGRPLPPPRCDVASCEAPPHVCVECVGCWISSSAE
jgi:hypothetical protein